MIKRFLFLLVIVIPIYCYAGEYNYPYKIKNGLYYTTNGVLYTGKIQEQTSSYIYSHDIYKGRVDKTIQRSLDTGLTVSYKYSYIDKYIRRVEMNDMSDNIVNIIYTERLYKLDKDKYIYLEEGKSITYGLNNTILSVFNYKKGKREGIAEITYGNNEHAEIFFKNNEPIYGYCYTQLAHKKVKLNQTNIYSLLAGKSIICLE